MERDALINLAQVASALGPSIKRRTLVDQGDNREIIVGPGKKIPTLPTIKEEVEVTNGGKHTEEVIPHTIPQTTNTSPPLPPPLPIYECRRRHGVVLRTIQHYPRCTNHKYPIEWYQ